MAGPDFVAGAPPVLNPPPGSPFGVGPPPPSGRGSGTGSRGSWIGRHKLLTAALVVIALLALGGVATAGAVLVANRSDNKTTASGSKSGQPQPSSSLNITPPPSAPPSSNATSPEHKAACNKADAPNAKAVGLVQARATKSMSNAAIIAALPSVQADLIAAAAIATGVLKRDLQEYAAAVGNFRTALVQSRESNTAAAKVLIYSIVLKAECDF